jgi:HEAT repeat protein
MAKTTKLSFQKLLDALLNEDAAFPPQYLPRFTDLPPAELVRLHKVWNQVPLWRRQALLEDLEELSEADTIMLFDGVGRIALNDTDPKVRMIAVRMLSDYDDPALLPTYLQLVEADPDAAVRAAAASALGTFIYQGEIEELAEKKLRQVEEMLLRVTQGQDDLLVRRRALEALGFSGRSEVPPLIEAAYHSKNVDWVISALFAMGRSANEQWRTAVMAMLDSARPEIRTEAVQAAGELSLVEARQPLLALLDEDDENVRLAAVWSLSQIGGPGVRDALEARLEEAEDDEEADFIEMALENLAFNDDLGMFSLIDLDDADLDESEPLEDDDEPAQDDRG